MDRRNFLRSLVGGVAMASAVRSFPFRVFSFPSEIIIDPYLSKEALRKMIEQMKAANVMPLSGNRFYGYVHPMVMHDIVKNRTWGKTINLFRYNLEAA